MPNMAVIVAATRSSPSQKSLSSSLTLFQHIADLHVCTVSSAAYFTDNLLSFHRVPTVDPDYKGVTLSVGAVFCVP